jgi:carboxypeptidase Taq
MDRCPNLKELLSYTRDSQLLCAVSALTSWDQETMIPQGAHDIRSEMMSLLSGMIHERKTSAKFKETLEKYIDLEDGHLKKDNLNPTEKACLREWRRDYLLATKLPSSFVKKWSQLTSKASQVWAESRQKDDFSLFSPYLEEIFALARQKADYLGYDNHPYDALLDEFEPHATKEQLDPLFDRLKKGLVSLLQDLKKASSPDTKVLQQHFPKKLQKQLGQQLFSSVFPDLSHARVDVSTHPFCQSMHPTDIRLTTRIDEKDFLSNLLSIMHETGHALYEHGLEPDLFGTPAGEAISLGIHESQSRWWETLVGRSHAFWNYFYPQFQKVFTDYVDVPLDKFYLALHKVTPSFIRVESDEVTYCLHVILRYELEKKLLEGSLEVKDLPEAWNDLFQKLLGITPPTNTLGCLQDVHWSFGLIGYFPTYALGNMYACQFFSQFEEENPNWEQEIAKGSFSPMQKWLKEHIHRHGRVYTAQDLVQKVTGKTLSEKAYLTHLRSKYSKIYHLSSDREEVPEIG